MTQLGRCCLLHLFMLEFDLLMPIAFATSRLAADWDLPSGPGSFKGWMATQKDIGSNDLELLLRSPVYLNRSSSIQPSDPEYDKTCISSTHRVVTVES